MSCDKLVSRVCFVQTPVATTRVAVFADIQISNPEILSFTKRRLYKDCTFESSSEITHLSGGKGYI
jgi:hypothetical protein